MTEDIVVSDYCLAVDSLRVGDVPPPAGEELLCFEREGRWLCNGTDREEESFCFGPELKLVPRKDRFLGFMFSAVDSACVGVLLYLER
ncbi:hypothetical protein TNIN_137361 [Trichonephila inaurata madagascariensis]|uniref:Uncharacterized protein n=1 Tax=Trichonephila inaurata madagascariensis TaxID=2747483 RepID=A0A8X6IJV2_9ARAC|nr:hypothetical protein TNIN_137361 [Trichonephila inaurata madagascariensis]